MNRLTIRRPEEGWLPLALVTLMCLTLAWAVDDPGWVNGKQALTDSLPLCALLGVAIGFGGPKLGWGRWTTHLVGAACAGLLIPILAGWAKLPGSSVAEAFRETAEGTVQAYLDIAWLGHQFTSEEIHYILVLGIVVWATAQFAAHAVFGHRRPLSAVLVIGLVLIANMALTSRDQLPHLVVFTGAALFLLIGMHVFDERATWVRRRIGDPASIAALYLRGGTVFVVLALVGSLTLTQRASSAPLAGAWTSFDNELVEVAEAIGRLFPVGGDLRPGGGVTFGSSVRISAQWFSDDSVAFTATTPLDKEGEPLWRAATYDRFVLTGWDQTDVTRLPVAAGESLLAGTPEDPSPDLTTEVTVEVRPDDFHDGLLLSPGTPVSVTRDVNVVLGGADGWFAGVDVPAGSQYSVVARVLRLSDEDVISRNRLRAASRDYPPDIVARYTEVPDGAIGPDAADLLSTILQGARTDNPYDIAAAIEVYLRNNDLFTYDPDIRDIDCSAGTVECFARWRTGYCLQYASTMAILLRAAVPDNRIPTRLVQGFLPGDRVGNTETVRNRNAHAWVEVYFPGYGWIPFDPTGGGIGRAPEINEGPVVASAAPTASASRGDDVADPTRRIPGASGATPAGPSDANRPGDRTLFIVITGLLILLVAGAAFAAWMRGPRGELSPDRAWLTMSRVAGRLGFGPRPTQTPYEYATTLGDLVPVARSDLNTVAHAKVESEYARVRLGGMRLREVREATRRLRVSLLRLVLLRGWRRRR